MSDDLAGWQFKLLIGELAQLGVVVPLEGTDPCVLNEAELRSVREALTEDSLPVLEQLVGMGAFGVHEPLSAEELEILRRKMETRRAVDALAEDEYRRLLAREQARSRLFAEKTARVQERTGGERLVLGGSVFDEPDQVPAVWGTGNFVLRAAGQGTMIASQQGLGKTTVAQQMALHRIGVRTGDFLGYPVTSVQEGEALLYIAADRPQQAMGSFRRMVDPGEAGVRELLDARLLVWKGPLPFDVVQDPQAFADWLDALSEKHERRIVDVVVDSVKDMAGGNSLSKDETGGALNLAWQEAMARGADLFLLHHQRKAAGGEKRPNALDDIFGSTLITSGLGSVFALDGESGASVVDLIHVKQPLEAVEFKLSHDHATGTTVPHSGSSDDFTVEGLLILAASAGATVRELAEALHGKYTDSTKKAVTRDLAVMLKAGSAKKVSGGVTPQGKTPDRWYFQGVAGL